MKNRGYAKFGGVGGGGWGDEKASLWEIWKWRINTFFLVASQLIKTKTFIDLKITRKSVKLVR